MILACELIEGAWSTLRILLNVNGFYRDSSTWLGLEACGE